MGNTRSQFEERFNINYGFIQTIEDPIYGVVKIYRKKFQNYHYVMIIDKKIDEFNNKSFIRDCIKPKTQQNQHDKLTLNHPKLFTGQYQNQNDMNFHSVKMQKLKRTFELIKRYQDELMVPLFSYQVIQGNIQMRCVGNNLQCKQPLIRIYLQYQNHKLFEYLQVIRSKKFPLKTSQLIYILKSISSAILSLEKMQIQSSFNEINFMSIYATNQGEVKINPIEIITKKQCQMEQVQHINSITQINSGSTVLQKRIISSQSNTLQSSNTVNYEKKSNNSQTISGSTADNFSSISLKFIQHKQILKNLLIQLSGYTLGDSDPLQSKRDCQNISSMIMKANSLQQIIKRLMNYNCKGVDRLLVERLYDDDNKSEKNHVNDEKINNKKIEYQNIIKNNQNFSNQQLNQPSEIINKNNENITINNNKIKQQQNNNNNNQTNPFSKNINRSMSVSFNRNDNNLINQDHTEINKDWNMKSYGNLINIISKDNLLNNKSVTHIQPINQLTGNVNVHYQQEQNIKNKIYQNVNVKPSQNHKIEIINKHEQVSNNLTHSRKKNFSGHLINKITPEKTQNNELIQKKQYKKVQTFIKNKQFCANDIKSPINSLNTIPQTNINNYIVINPHHNHYEHFNNQINVNSLIQKDYKHNQYMQNNHHKNSLINKSMNNVYEMKLSYPQNQTNSQFNKIKLSNVSSVKKQII